ncbi:MAG TPA: hypothetical protein GX398_07315 [Candidatus Cloacimonetes bacterium]|nr:hypothetical protein [Candidatus Cloacimonadota bacterium]
MNIRKEKPMPESRCTLRLIIALGLISLSLLSFGCKSLTKPRVGSIRGKVVLENDSGDPAFDNADLSGIKVTLYKPVALDSTIVRIRSIYPVLGTDMHQSMVFDPRKESPVKSTTTNAEGRYEFKDVSAGQYHLVFEKDGWGPVVEHHVATGKSIDQDGEGGFGSKELVTTTMYPIVHIPATVTDEFTFKNRHTYMVGANASFLAPVHFEGHSRVRLAPNVGISFFNDIIYDDASNHYVTFTSLDHGPDDDLPPLWGAVRSYKDNQIVKNWSVEHSSGGIIMNGNHAVVTSCVIRDSDTGINIQAECSKIENIIFDGIISRAVFYDQVQGSDIIKQQVTNCIFKSCREGLRTRGQAVRISNNYFIDCDNGLFSYDGYHIIRNNTFDRNVYAICITSSTICIEYNDFYDNRYSVRFVHEYHEYLSNPRFANNNFYQTTSYAFWIRADNPQGDIDAKNNYWASSDINTIIHDANDDPELDCEIIYLPKKSQPIAGAGVVANP